MRNDMDCGQKGDREQHADRGAHAGRIELVRAYAYGRKMCAKFEEPKEYRRQRHEHQVREEHWHQCDEEGEKPCHHVSEIWICLCEDRKSTRLNSSHQI